MDDVERIVDELRRSFEGEAWHGPSLMEVFGDVDAATAARPPAAGGHSIWQILRHVQVWIDLVRGYLEGRPLPELAPEEDWPPVEDHSPEAWERAVESLRASDEGLRSLAATWPASRLDEIVPGKPYSVRVMLHGLAQHNAYHGGQVAVLKRGRLAGRDGPSADAAATA